MPLACAAVALAAFGNVLGMFFTSDDYYFLGIVAPATSPFVIFEPLVGRFVRPLVVGLYYVNYHAFGLTPWPYHVSTLACHTASGYLIYLTARRLDPSDTIWAFLAALVFLVFGGHSEAVAWPAGSADPILAAALLTAFYCYLRAVEPGARALWLVPCFAALAIATQAKEAWVVFPGILVAHAVVFGRSAPFHAHRAALVIAVAIAIVAVYLLFRRIVFGSVTGGFSGLGSSLSGGVFDEQIRAFLIKCFLPSGSIAARLWLSGRDQLVWFAAVLLVAVFARGRNLRMIVFAMLATACALLPVLPLTISVATTESERFVYLASVFSCLLVAWAIRAVVRPRWAAIAVCLAVAALHATALVRANARWRAAGALTRGIVETFADVTNAHDPGGRSAIYILNLPDNLLGAYVFRVGFYPAVELVRPDARGRIPLTVGVASHSIVSMHDPVSVTRLGPRSFAVDFGGNRIIQPQIRSLPEFRITSQTATSYHIEFTDVVADALVLHVSAGRTEFAGRIGR